MRHLCGVVFCGLLTAGVASAADRNTAPAVGWSLDMLMANLHQIRSASAHFVELKTVHMLTRPIRAEGTLSYVAPDRLEKITTAPAPETIRLDGQTLTGTRSNGEDYTVDIAGHSEIAAMVEGIRSTLAGDLPTLQRYYTITFSGGPDRWQMDLAPKDRRVREKVDRIRISGAGTIIDMIAVEEKDGDRSEMTITPDTP
jgi:outer membrane lipoprotein-sorting protein